MAATLSAFEPIEGIDGLYTATKDQLRCTAIQLKSGGICLYSPVAGLDTAAKENLEEIGPVEFLLAPNHYHNKGLVEYHEAYPDAKTIAPEASHDRLEKQTGLEFKSMDPVLDLLPRTMHFASPAGLKTGETWLLVSGNGNTGWLVVDAFSGAKNPNGKECHSPHLLGTFPNFGIGNKAAYVQWLRDLIKSHPPNILVPFHGSIIRNVNLGKQLKDLMAEKIGVC
ncbi:MAG: hypothetical protein AAGA76_15250 [Pseudomonadota bacterium]